MSNDDEAVLVKAAKELVEVCVLLFLVDVVLLVLEAVRFVLTLVSNIESRRDIATSLAVVRGGEYRDHVAFMGPVVSIHNQLVGPCNSCEVMEWLSCSEMSWPNE